MTPGDLAERRNWSLEHKIEYTSEKIREWYEYFDGNVYAAFSGGIDSTVLLDIARSIYPHLTAVFVNTGLEYPEIKSFVRQFENVEWLRPKIPFHKVIEQYGYPVVSKRVSRYVSDLRVVKGNNSATVNLRNTGFNRKGEFCPSMKLSNKWRFLIGAPFKISANCCLVMKEAPLRHYARISGKRGITGVTAAESNTRLKTYLRQGCNAFTLKHPLSSPLGFWEHQDILAYIASRNLKISEIYGRVVNLTGTYETTGEQRTGCMFCCFGIHYDSQPNRFQRMAITHPKEYAYCIKTLGIGRVLDYLNVKY